LVEKFRAVQRGLDAAESETKSAVRELEVFEAQHSEKKQDTPIDHVAQTRLVLSIHADIQSMRAGLSEEIMSYETLVKTQTDPDADAHIDGKALSRLMGLAADNSATREEPGALDLVRFYCVLF
jgi:hypothetical protein